MKHKATLLATLLLLTLGACTMTEVETESTTDKGGGNQNKPAVGIVIIKK